MRSALFHHIARLTAKGVITDLSSDADARRYCNSCGSRSLGLARFYKQPRLFQRVCSLDVTFLCGPPWDDEQDGHATAMLMLVIIESTMQSRI